MRCRLRLRIAVAATAPVAAADPPTASRTLSRVSAARPYLLDPRCILSVPVRASCGYSFFVLLRSSIQIAFTLLVLPSAFAEGDGTFLSALSAPVHKCG